jgi:hypothetical protein
MLFIFRSWEGWKEIKAVIPDELFAAACSTSLAISFSLWAPGY